MTQQLREKRGYTYLFLCDTKAEMIRRLNILHPHGGIEGADIARPAEFLLDSSGTVRWVYLTDDFRKRLHADEFLKAVDSIHPNESASK